MNTKNDEKNKVKSNLRISSLVAFILAIPSLIIVDWYYKGYGVLVAAVLIAVGLILDQVVRLKFPRFNVDSEENYKTNKVLNIFALVAFVMSPVALIYLNRCVPKLGFWIMAVMIFLGLTLNQVARIKFSYNKIK